jgi:hypothetical protein
LAAFACKSRICPINPELPESKAHRRPRERLTAFVADEHGRANKTLQMLQLEAKKQVVA